MGTTRTVGNKVRICRLPVIEVDAIIGDGTGGANVQGTFKLAMDQLNLLQPEFVINVGDIIEGYSMARSYTTLGSNDC